MDAVRIYGGKSLSGQTRIQGSKNASLPILAATLLIDGICEIENCPDISDVYHMLRLLESLGCQVSREKNHIRVDTGGVAAHDMPSDSVGVMRSSIMLLGALLARMGAVSMEYPGGCVIGKRPIDQHLCALRRMGVEIVEGREAFCAKAVKLHGAVQELIHPAAREPEIQALCEFLLKAGAEISGVGTDRLVIRGVKKLHPVRFRVPADRIVAGTYLTACLCAGGSVFLEDAPCEQMQSVLACAERMGAGLTVWPDGLFVEGRACNRLEEVLVTEVYPGFPTDLQSLFMAAMALSGQGGQIEETVFENRFRIVPELCKMGADITVEGNRAHVRGGGPLHNTIVEAKELRGGAALVVAALAAEGTGIVRNRHFIDRGYEDITLSLRELGADIELA